MFLRLLACFMLLMLGSSLHAQEKSPGPPPSLLLLGKVDPQGGTFGFTGTVVVSVPVTEKRKVVENGVERLYDVVTLRTVTKQEVSTQAMKDWRVQTTKGRVLPVDEAWHKMKVGMVVARSGNDQPPDEAYLAALHPDTLVLVPIPKK